MKTHIFARRIAAVSIMVASAALPAGVAHSAASSEAPVVAHGALANVVDTQSRPVVADLGLPAKPVAVVVKKAPEVTVLTLVAAPAPAAPAPVTPQVATAKTPATGTTKKSTTTKRTTTTTTKAAAVAPAAPAPAAAAPAATASSVTARQDLAASVAAATNAQRVAAGLKPLAYRSCSVSSSWALHLASVGGLTHNNMMTVLTGCGGTSTAGENIAAGFATPAGVTAGWMASPGHKANILNANYKTISVGVAQAANGTYYWVENFTG